MMFALSHNLKATYSTGSTCGYQLGKADNQLKTQFFLINLFFLLLDEHGEKEPGVWIRMTLFCVSISLDSTFYGQVRVLWAFCPFRLGWIAICEIGPIVFQFAWRGCSFAINKCGLSANLMGYKELGLGLYFLTYYSSRLQDRLIILLLLDLIY